MATIDTMCDSRRAERAPEKRSFMQWLDMRMAVRRSRLDLMELTDDQLQDIGISADQARREGLRPWWE